MIDLEANSRRSGRTTRMIAYALTLAADGQQVLMVFQTAAQAKEAICTVELNKTSWVAYANINACSAFAAPDINWHYVMLTDNRNSIALLVDHEVIHQKYAWAIEAYSRFNASPDDPVYAAEVQGTSPNTTANTRGKRRLRLHK